MLRFGTVNSFWPTYLLTALVGSAAINFSAPRFRSPSESLNGTDMPSPSRLIDTAAPDAVRAAPPAAPVSDVVLEPEVASVPAALATQTETVPIAVPPAPAATEPRPAAPGMRTGKWGVTTTQTTSYEPDGTRIGRLQGGTLVEVQGATKSSRGSMTICRYLQGEAWQGPVLISENHLAFFNGSVADLPSESLASLRGYFETKGLIDARTAELTRQQVDANPYTVPYRQSYEELTALQARAKALTTERDSATGSERMRSIEDLRRMKDEQARLRQTFDRAQAQYRNWKEQHATTPSADPAADPQIQAWERRMAALAPDVRKMLPVP